MTTTSNRRSALLILTVLYQQSISEAATLQSLLAAAGELTEKDTLLLWDNSPKPQTAAALRHFSEQVAAQVLYRHHPENTPLARVYNEAIALPEPYDLLVFLDQDSSFDGLYLQRLQKAAADFPEITLFAPLIKVGKQVVSPGHFRYFKGKYWSRPRLGKVPSRNTIAVMSGLALRHSFFMSFGGFDERFRLYGIDTNLLLRYARLHSHLYVLDAPFGHDLSDFNQESTAAKERRFKDFCHGSRLNAEWLSPPARWLSALFVTYRRLRFRGLKGRP